MGGLVDAIFGGGDSPPPPPDYRGAAQETAKGNLEAAKYATVANRANQYNPYGSLTWQRGATDYDPWTQTVNFTPEGQKQFNLQNQLQTKFAETANTGFDQARQVFESPNIDESTLPKRAIDAGQTAQEAILSRLEPTLESDEEKLRTRLANQGIGLGSTAYNREMALQGQRGTDLRLQAAMQGINLDQAARAAALNEAYTAQSRPLDLINALRTGGQVQNPQFQPYAQQQYVGGPNMSQAAQSQYGAELGAYNAQNAQQNGLLGGIAGIGLGLAGLPGAGGSILQGAKGLFA